MTTENNEHPFAQYLQILGKGSKGSRSLDQQEAYAAFTAILKGEVEELQLGGFLMLLRVKEESPEEIAGFVQSCKDFIAAPKNITADIDWSSYAGKRKYLPWFIASLLVAAQQGYRVFIHGAKGDTEERLFTEQLFRHLGLPIATSWQEAGKLLDSDHLCYMPVEAFCAPLQKMLQMRNLLGVRSSVNTLVRLINPLGARYSFQSVFHPGYAATHQQAAHLLGQPNMAVFKGEGGEIERKPNATCLVKNIIQGELHEEKWPRLLDETAEPDTHLDLEHFREVWRGTARDDYATLAITGTLAVVLKLVERLETFEAAQSRANELWNNRDKQRL